MKPVILNLVDPIDIEGCRETCAECGKNLRKNQKVLEEFERSVTFYTCMKCAKEAIENRIAELQEEYDAYLGLYVELEMK